MPVNGPDCDADDTGPEYSPVPVLVVDDQASFRAALRDLVAATEGFVLVGESASGDAALVAVDELSPRLAIIDKRMPGIGGIEASREIKRQHPEIVVLLITVEEAPIHRSSARVEPRAPRASRSCRPAFSESFGESTEARQGQ